MRHAIALVLTGLAAGCGNQLAEREAMLNRFVGQPESAVVQQMGVPSRTYETGGVKYLAYSEHRIDIVPGFPAYTPFWPGWYGGGIPPQVIELRCETTFEVTQGTVRAFTLRGNACS
jgi:hypothetical protein